jgi:hypothetical protein
MLTTKWTWIFLLVAPWLMAQMVFSQGGVPGKRLIPAAAPTEAPQVKVSLPQPGEALQGVVSISGTTDVPGFRSAQVDFAYRSNPTGTWFLIQQSSAPVKEGALAAWDTTTITDGEYRLRVQVFLQDGTVMESVVNSLRVRNYTIIETSTPEAQPAGQATAMPTATPRPDFQVQTLEATPLPTNPAQVTIQDLQASALRGVLAVFCALLVGALYLGVRALTRR